MSIKYGIRSILLFFFIILLGCAGKLRPDPIPVSAIDANYPTAEIVAEGQRFNGLGILYVKPGTAMSTLGIYLQGYYKGTFTIDSSKCKIHDKFRYDGFTLHKISLTGTFKESCFLDIVASHEWPKESSSGIEISAVKGRIWLVSKKALTKVSKSHEFETTGIEIPVSGESARVVFRGCSSTFDKRIEAFDHIVTALLDDVIEITGHARCGLVGAAVDNTTKTAIYWMAWIYNVAFEALPVPVIARGKRKIDIEADPGVSIISLGNTFEISNKASFKMDWSKPYVLRLITVKGRLLIGEWNPSKEEWLWKD